MIPGRTRAPPLPRSPAPSPVGEVPEEASVAGPLLRVENRSLAVEAEYAGVDVWLPEQDAGVVDQIPGGEVVRAVYDDVYSFRTSSALEESSRISWPSIDTWGFTWRSFRAATCAFAMPKSSSEYMVWRCRLLFSTTSSSTIPTRPTPAAAR